MRIIGCESQADLKLNAENIEIKWEDRQTVHCGCPNWVSFAGDTYRKFAPSAFANYSAN